MTPKLTLGAREIKKQFHPFLSTFLRSGMNKSIKMVSWLFPNRVFRRAVFSHRKASPSNKKRWGQGGFSFICYGCIEKEIDGFESQKFVLL